MCVASGPSADHTLKDNTGHYMIVEAAKGDDWEEAELVSPVLQPCTTTCQLEFFYHMYGQGVGDLSVYLRAADGVSRDTEVRSARTNQITARPGAL